MAKMLRLFFLLIFLALTLSATAQQSCCEIKKNAGQSAFNKGDYLTAIAKWSEGKGCSDQSCADFKALVEKAKRWNERRAKEAKEAADALTEKNRLAAEDKLAIERIRMEQEKKAAAANAADDSFWDALKDGGIADCNKYLAKYPTGRHASEAKKKKEALELAATVKQPNPQPVIENIREIAGMVYIKGDSYTMGDIFGEGSSHERPTHNVTVDGFYMGKTEVTFEEFDAFCSATGRKKPSDNDWGRGKRPVINVDWYDAIEYCNWLSQKQGLNPVYSIDKSRKDPNNLNPTDTKKWLVSINWNAKGYRLPTEAEWEFAAREVGKKIRFGNGKDFADPAQLNFNPSETPNKGYILSGKFREGTVLVSEMVGAVNGLGLRHMSGNVWEWCSDWYDASYYQNSPSKNPRGPDTGQYRVLRGGSWLQDGLNARCASRVRSVANDASSIIGFRVVLPY